MFEDFRNTRQPQNWYDTAQICPNGHVITPFAVSLPVGKKEFCNQCGEKTFMTCEGCGAPIQGHRHTPSLAMVHYLTPRFCHNCGAMFPWTKLYLEEARELVEEFQLTEAEKTEMKQSIENLAKGVKTEIAKAKFNRLLVKGGQQLSGALLSLMVNLVSGEMLIHLTPK